MLPAMTTDQSAPCPAFDLRPLLAGGTDPLPLVVERAARLGQGQKLLLEAPFDPLPLRRVLANMGVSSIAERLAEGHWRIILERAEDAALPISDSAERCPGPPDCGAPTRSEDGRLHIDVRGLAAPLPMLAILRLVGAIEDDTAVVVHHDRDPIYLIPELAEIGWGLEPLGGEAGELLFLLQRSR
jgi:uncharacterized protein (DUF2249 family)